MANELGGSVATLNPRALIAPSSLSCPVTPVRGPRPLFAHLRIVFFTFSFEEDLSEEGKKKEEAGSRHPQLWRRPRA